MPRMGDRVNGVCGGGVAPAAGAMTAIGNRLSAIRNPQSVIRARPHTGHLVAAALPISREQEWTMRNNLFLRHM